MRNVFVSNMLPNLPLNFHQWALKDQPPESCVFILLLNQTNELCSTCAAKCMPNIARSWLKSMIFHWPYFITFVLSCVLCSQYFGEGRWLASVDRTDTPVPGFLVSGGQHTCIQSNLSAFKPGPVHHQRLATLLWYMRLSQYFFQT